MIFYDDALLIQLSKLLFAAIFVGTLSRGKMFWSTLPSHFRRISLLFLVIKYCTRFNIFMMILILLSKLLPTAIFVGVLSRGKMFFDLHFTHILAEFSFFFSVWNTVYFERGDNKKFKIMYYSNISVVYRFLVCIDVSFSFQ